MTNLTLYLDESFTDRTCVVAGYLGLATMWHDSFDPKWREAMAGAPRKLTEFKASDCRQRRGEFQGWHKDECDSVTQQVVSVIADACVPGDLVGFGGAIVYPAAPTPPHRRRIQQHGFLNCLIACLSDALDVAAGFSSATGDGTVSIVLDKRKGFWDCVVRSFNDVRGIIDPSTVGRLRDPTPGDSKNLPGVQAADLLAYELRKEIQNRIEGRRPSAALEELVTRRFHRAQCVSLPSTLQMQSLRARGERIPSTIRTLLVSGTPLRSPGYWTPDASDVALP